MQSANQPFRQFPAAVGWPSRADNTDDMSVRRPECSLGVQDEGPVGALSQPERIVLIRQRPDAYAVPVDPLGLLLRTLHSLRHAGFVEMPPCLLRRAVTVQQGETFPKTRSEEETKGDIEEGTGYGLWVMGYGLSVTGYGV